MKTFLPILLLSVLALPAAHALTPQQRLTVIREAAIDSATCEHVTFDGEIGTLAGTTADFAITSSVAPATTPIAGKRLLKIAFLAGGHEMSSVRILAPEARANALRGRLEAGESIRVTESSKCASLDSSLTAVDLVTFHTPVAAPRAELGTVLAMTRKNPEGQCAVLFSKSLGELVTAANPGIDLATVKADVSVFANGFDTASGELRSKRVLITFSKPLAAGMTTTLTRPRISIGSSRVLVDQILDRLATPGATVGMTGARDCWGERADNPIRVTEITLN